MNDSGVVAGISATPEGSQHADALARRPCRRHRQPDTWRTEQRRIRHQRMGPDLDASREVDAGSQRRRLLRLWHPSDLPGSALALRGPDDAADARGQQRDDGQYQQLRPDPGHGRDGDRRRELFGESALPGSPATVPSSGSRIRRQSGSFRCSAAIPSASPRGSTTRGRPSGSPVRAATARCFRCRSGRTPCSGTRTGQSTISATLARPR